MGNQFSSKFGGRTGHVVLAGLDGAGKTTLLYGVALGDTEVTPVPTAGFNLQRIEVGNAVMDVCDLGGNETDRAHWPEYYSNVDGLVFMVDAADHARLHEARRALHELVRMDDRLAGKPVLVFANGGKAGPNPAPALSPDEISDRLGLAELPPGVPRAVFAVTALDPTSARAGLSWLCDAMALKPSVTAPLASLFKRRRADQPRALPFCSPTAASAAAAAAGATGRRLRFWETPDFTEAVAAISVDVVLRITFEAILRAL